MTYRTLLLVAALFAIFLIAGCGAVSSAPDKTVNTKQATGTGENTGNRDLGAGADGEKLEPLKK